MGEHGNKTLCHKVGKLRLNQMESHFAGRIHFFLYEHQIQGEHATIIYRLLQVCKFRGEKRGYGGECWLRPNSSVKYRPLQETKCDRQHITMPIPSHLI
jgi:hypothetical protein